MSRVAIALSSALAIALGGCASNLSGLGGAPAYACKAPVGAQCTSVSGVYANALLGMAVVPNPPASNSVSASTVETKAAKPVVATTPHVHHEHAQRPTIASPTGANALRSSPRVLRMWVAPWEDADGDLHEDSVVHVVVDTGRWLIERVRPAPRARLDAVAPPRPLATSPATPPAEPGPSATRPPSPADAPVPDADPAMER